MILLSRLDHFVLTVTSVEVAAEFYAHVLGFCVDKHAHQTDFPVLQRSQD
jgi:catechol 2,3-dioxygenase-like lactoylglutathione lyase family enzyme